MPRGRFAPTPSGPLHFGSVLAAAASFLDARASGGEWLVRIDDIDTPRNVPGAADAILRTLERLGLAWDGEVLHQSRRREAYREAFEALRAAGALYPCGCSRKAIGEGRGRGVDNTPVYPGTCKFNPPPDGARLAWRFAVPGGRLGFTDRVQGAVEHDLERDLGDFVVRRADGFPAYPLAVAVDDAFQGVTHAVRGSDLLGSVTRQVLLCRALGLAEPVFAHIPVAVDGRGDKLSKQTGARGIDGVPPGRVLVEALAFLGQDPPRDLAGAPPAEVLAWAQPSWDLSRVPRFHMIKWKDFAESL
ncbi:MAG: tRNA glutamyl-Q(34) synthetase GluQRS [Acidobacteria bacterium]|nr:tRNA glutamyl-Q(34) synthetase GluQRS [Acidobacteriota bacterium]